MEPKVVSTESARHASRPGRRKHFRHTHLEASHDTRCRNPPIRRRRVEDDAGNVFHGPGDIRVEEVPRPEAGPGEAVIRVTTTTICGTDVHILKGEYPVRPGLVIGHEPVGVIEELGAGVTGYEIGERVLVGAITPCGQCRACLSGNLSQCGHGEGYRGPRRLALRQHHRRRAGRVPPRPVRAGEPDAHPGRRHRRAGRPARRHRLDRLQWPPSRATCGSATRSSCSPWARSACAPSPGAKLTGASLIIGVDSDPVRLEMAKRMGADVVLDFTQVDVVAEVKRLTGGGADVTIEALGTQGTFENALRCLRPGGTLSSLGVYSGKLQMPYDAFAAGLGDHRIVTTLCPGGKERMRRLIATVQSGRFDPLPLITHRFALDDIVEAYDLFSNRRDGVLKVAIRP